MSKLLSKPLLGTLLHWRYKVVEILQVGVENTTYLAEDTRQIGHPKCLVKQLKPANNDPSFWPTARHQFVSLVETLQKLDDRDQIPQLLAYFEENQAFYLVYEFIEGHPLSSELVSGKPWTEAEVIPLLQEVLGILEFVRSQGIIHPNIAPENLIRRTSDGQLVLINFDSDRQLGWTKNLMQSSSNLPKNCPNVSSLISAESDINCPNDLSVQEPKNIDNEPCANNDIYGLGKIGICALMGLNAEQVTTDFDWESWRQQLPAPISDHLANVLTQMVRSPFKNTRIGSCETLTREASWGLKQSANSEELTPADGSKNQQPIPIQNSPDSTVVGIDFPAISTSLLKVEFNPSTEESESSVDSAESMEYALKPIAKATESNADAEALPQQEEFTEEAPETSLQDSADQKNHPTRSFSLSRFLVMGGIGLGITANAVAIVFGLTTLLEASQIDPGLDIFAQATLQYEAGDYKQAVSLAKTVPAYSAVFYDAYDAINHWEQEWNNAGDRFKLVEIAFKQSRWLDVFKEANQLPKTSYWQNKIERFVQQAAPKTEATVLQALQSAQEQVKRGDFAAGLKFLYQIPQGVPNYDRVQVTIAEYKEKQSHKLEAKAHQLLVSASKKADAKDFNGAVKLIKQIPKGTTIYAKAQAKLVEYSQKRRVKADELLQQAYNRAANRDFMTAIGLLKQIPKGTPAYITAQSKLVEYGNKLGTAKTGSGTSATPAANRRDRPARSPQTRAALPDYEAHGGDFAIASPSTKTSRIRQSLNPGDFLQEVGSISMILPG